MKIIKKHIQKIKKTNNPLLRCVPNGQKERNDHSERLMDGKDVGLPTKQGPKNCINPFQANVPFLYSLKTGFLTFSGGTEMEYWREMS